MAIHDNYIETLNTCIDRLRAGENLDDILRDYPLMAAQLLPMLEAGLLVTRAHFPTDEVEQAQQNVDPTIRQVINTTFSGGISGLFFLLMILVGSGILITTIFTLSQNRASVPEIPSNTVVTTVEASETEDLQSRVTITDAITITPVVIEGTPDLQVETNNTLRYEGNNFDGEQTIFNYEIISSDDIDTFYIEIPTCDPPLEVATSNPPATNSLQPQSGLLSIQWNLISNIATNYSLSLDGQISEGIVKAVLVVDDDHRTVFVPGPACLDASEENSQSDFTSLIDDIVIIEGSVDMIEDNIITIYGLEIPLAETDPRLSVIQIGDILRIEGSDDGMGITALSIIFTNVEVYVDGGFVWRDDETCANPPPAWAPAWGWRLRCEGSAPSVARPEGGNLPNGCKLTGFGNGNIRVQCSRDSR